MPTTGKPHASAIVRSMRQPRLPSHRFKGQFSRIARAQFVKPSMPINGIMNLYAKRSLLPNPFNMSIMDKTSVPQPIVQEARQIEPLSLDLSLAEGVDKELTCAVCLGRYKHPKVLPCLHTYCKNCLESLLGSTSKLTCPQCKEIHEVPSGGIDSFKTYFTINNLIELLHIHEVSSCSGESGKTIQCESGLDEHAAVARCLSCSEYLCESCYGIHQRLKATRDHSMITLEKIRRSDKKLGVQSIQRKQYCEEHDDEVLKLFCKTCKKVICRDCALVKHREHDYSFIREVRPETRNQLELLLKKVEEKENEFQGHKKHVEGLQRSNEDTLNSCLKNANEMCDKLIEVIESRRAYLVAKLHSKHEAEEEQNKGEMNSLDLSLVRLSDSIRFTRKLLDDGNDVELMTVGMQAKEALEGLSTMEWNRDAVRPSLLRLKFSPAVEDMKTFGKVLNTIQSSDIFIENVPRNAYVHDELEFSVKLSNEMATRQYDATTLLSVTVTHNERKIPVAIQNNGLNNWNISCTPQDGGNHSIVVQFGQFSSQSYKFVAVQCKEVQPEISCAQIMPVCDAYVIPCYQNKEVCAENDNISGVHVPYEDRKDDGGKRRTDSAVEANVIRESSNRVDMRKWDLSASSRNRRRRKQIDSPECDEEVCSSQVTRAQGAATKSAQYPKCEQKIKSLCLEDSPGVEGMKVKHEISCEETMPVCDAYEMPCYQKKACAEEAQNDICIPYGDSGGDKSVEQMDYANEPKVAIETFKDTMEVMDGRSVQQKDYANEPKARETSKDTMDSEVMDTGEMESSSPYDQQVWPSQVCEKQATAEDDSTLIGEATTSAQYPRCGQASKSSLYEYSCAKKEICHSSQEKQCHGIGSTSLERSKPQDISYPVASSTPLHATTTSHYSMTSSRGRSSRGRSSYNSHQRHW